MKAKLALKTVFTLVTVALMGYLMLDKFVDSSMALMRLLRGNGGGDGGGGGQGAGNENNHANVLLSPLSISLALTGVMVGARGRTMYQMRNVIGLENPQLFGFEILDSMKSLLDQLNSTGSVVIANAIALKHQDYEVLEEYKATLESYLYSQVFHLNFHNPTQATSFLNAWAEKKTSGKIERMLTSNLPRDSKLVLLNAIHFKAQWRVPFPAQGTAEGNFTTSDGRLVKLQVMQDTFERLRMIESTQIGQVLELPYKGDQFAMYIHLPPKNTADKLDFSLADFLEDSKVVKELQPTECVHVLLPKFKLESNLELKDTLIKLGMTDAFDEKEANFEGIIGPQSNFGFAFDDSEPEVLTISSVVHSTFVSVDEQGTEAAAATVVKMKVRKSLGGVGVHCPVQFRVDRPFQFMIRHTGLRVNLFSGQVNRL